MEARPQKLAVTVKRLAIDTKLDARDYEYAETRREQVRRAGAMRGRLESLRAAILELSEHGVFTSVDVVQLSTLIDSLLAEVQ